MNINLKVKLQKEIISKFYEDHLCKLEIERKKISGDLQIIKNLDLLKLLLNHWDYSILSNIISKI